MPSIFRPSAPGLAPRLFLSVTFSLASLAFAVPLAAAPLQVPPIVSPASTEHHPGKPIFAELITPSLATAEPFYAGLFGWTFKAIPGGKAPYAEAYLGTNAVAGLVEKPMPNGERRQPAWLNFFATPDVDAAAKAATLNGGKVLVPPHDLAGRGREAILADAQGAVFAVLASSSGDPPDMMSAPGDWIWRSLITTDPAAGATFYSAVLGDHTQPLPPTPGETHLLMECDKFARATLNSLPPGHPTMHPHWLAYVRVDNVAKTVANVTALGGHVLVEPRLDRHGGMLAIVADPLGAPIGIMEWSEHQNDAVTK